MRMKAFALALAVALAVAGWAVPSVDGATITFHTLLQGGQPIADNIHQLVAMFEAQNPDIDVDVHFAVGTSGEFLNRLVTQFAARDTSIDVIAVDVIWPPAFVGAGWLEPMDGWISPDEARAFSPGAIQAATIGGKLYALPWYYDAGLLYYRKDLLDKYGFEPPRTWDELKEQAKTIVAGEGDPGLAGFLFQGAKIEALTNSYLEMLWGMGGDVLDEDGNVILDTPEGKGLEALRLFLSMVEDGVTPRSVVEQSTDDTRLNFQAGRAVFLRNWVYGWGLFQGDDSAVKGKVGIATLPSTEGYPPAATLGGWFIGVSSYSRNKEAAMKFAQYLAGFEAQKFRAVTQSYLPARLSVYDDPEVLAVNPQFADLLPVVEAARARPRVPEYTQISAIMQTYLNAALAGQMRAEDAVRDMAAEIGRALGR